MSKKRLLFIDKTFALGGIQSSMLTLIDILSDEYEIDLFAFHPEGPLKNRLNPAVKLITPDWRVDCIGMSLSECLKKGSFKQKLFRIWATVHTKLFNNSLPLKLAFSHQPKLQDYDAAIAYHHEMDKHTVLSGFSRFLIERVEAKKKIAWIHYDASSHPQDEVYNFEIYSKLDKIVCVSGQVKKALTEKCPGLKCPVEVFYNTVDCEKIYSLAGNATPAEFDQSDFNMVSVCRLNPEKALDRGVHAIADTVRRHPGFKWFILGEGPEKNKIQSAIREEKLEDRIMLIGHRDNPYPYIKHADLLAVLSYHDAAPMVYTEAKTLGTHVFTTRLLSSEEMLREGTEATICENTENGIREGFDKFMDGRAISLKDQNVNSSPHMNGETKARFYSLIKEQS